MLQNLILSRANTRCYLYIKCNSIKLISEKTRKLRQLRNLCITRKDSLLRRINIEMIKRIRNKLVTIQLNLFGNLIILYFLIQIFFKERLKRSFQERLLSLAKYKEKSTGSLLQDKSANFSIKIILSILYFSLFICFFFFIPLSWSGRSEQNYKIRNLPAFERVENYEKLVLVFLRHGKFFSH